MTLHWRGDLVVAKVERAAAEETREVVDRAVVEARELTPVLTGAAQNSLTRENDGLRITWGYHVLYGIWIEIGARGRAGIHALRRAGDHHYGRLARGIAARLGWF